MDNWWNNLYNFFSPQTQTQTPTTTTSTLGFTSGFDGGYSGGGGGGGGGGSILPTGATTTVTSPTTSTSGNLNTVTSSPVTEPAPTGPSLEEQYRLDQERLINDKYNSYFGYLDQTLNSDLPQQRTTNESLVQGQYDKNVLNITNQRASQERNLAETQNRSLKDLSANIRNLFQAGNVYLGSRGAGDSSAASQYSYALNKVGTRARGDIQSQINQRRNQISDIANQEINRLDSELTNQKLQISNWFYSQQEALKQMRMQGELSRYTDLQTLSSNLYNQALSALMQAKADYTNYRNSLTEWVTRSASSLDGAMQTLQKYGFIQPNTQLSGTNPTVSAGGYYNVPIGYGGVKEEQRYNILGQPIQ